MYLVMIMKTMALGDSGAAGMTGNPTWQWALQGNIQVLELNVFTTCKACVRPMHSNWPCSYAPQKLALAMYCSFILATEVGHEKNKHALPLVDQLIMIFQSSPRAKHKHQAVGFQLPSGNISPWPMSSLGHFSRADGFSAVFDDSNMDPSTL